MLYYQLDISFINVHILLRMYFIVFFLLCVQINRFRSHSHIFIFFSLHIM